MSEALDREDAKRRDTQINHVRRYMVARAGVWLTLETISRETGVREHSLSARLSDLRKPKYGAYIIERRRKPGKESQGINEYRLVVPEAKRGQLDLGVSD